MQIKKIFIVIISIFLFTACQPAPNTTNKNGAAKAQNSGESLAQQEKTMQQQLDLQDVLSSSPKSIKTKFNSEKRELNIDATVTVPEIDELSIYKLEPKNVSKEFLESILITYFGDQAPNIVYDNEYKEYRLGNYSDSSTVEYFTLFDSTQAVTNQNYITLTGHLKNHCPWESNIYTDHKEFDLKSSEAIKLCEQFIKDIGLMEYVFYGIDTYGKSVGTDYYKVSFSKQINGMPLSSKLANTFIDFDVTTDGIYSISGKLYDVKQIEKVTSIISPESAIAILESQLDNTFVLCKDDGVFTDYMDEYYNLKKINIKKIALEYEAVNKSDAITLIPVWKFYIGIENYISSSSLLSINAMNGEVLYIG